MAAFSRERRSGALTQLPGKHACIADTGTRSACPVATAGLHGAGSVTLSRDGRSAYVTGFLGGSVAVLARDPETGALRPAGCVFDAEAPSTPKTTTCATEVTGIEGPRDVALSPDGDFAYVPASVGGSIAAFAVAAPP